MVWEILRRFFGRGGRVIVAAFTPLEDAPGAA